MEELDKRRSEFMTENHFVHKGLVERHGTTYEIYADEVKVLVLRSLRIKPLIFEVWLKKKSWDIDWCNFRNNDIGMIEIDVVHGNDSESMYESQTLPSEVVYYDSRPRMIYYQTNRLKTMKNQIRMKI